MVSAKNMKVASIGILTGCTASGKTSLAIELAVRYGRVEIINADSLLVYKKMNIGTAKPTAAELAQIPHHLIDLQTPDQNFTAGEFFRAAESMIQEIQDRGNRPLIVGGTGFYLKSLLFGLWDAPSQDASFRKSLDAFIGQADRYRLVRALELIYLTGQTPSELQAQLPAVPDPRFNLWILDREPTELDRRIKLRTGEMIQNGLIEEVAQLQAEFPESRALLAVGYAQTVDFLAGKKPAGRKLPPGLPGLQDEIELATRQLVKSQRTWFRGQMARVPSSRWFVLDKDRSDLEEAFKAVYAP
jgi:tRNA dimethylallyltransferase